MVMSLHPSFSEFEQPRRIGDQDLLLQLALRREQRNEVDEVAVIGITLTFGCGQSVPQITRSAAVSTIFRANGTASTKGGPAEETRSQPQTLTQHFSSRCISSISVLNGSWSSPSAALTRPL